MNYDNRSFVRVYVNDEFVGGGYISVDAQGAIHGSMMLEKSKLDATPFNQLHMAYYSFEFVDTNMMCGYYTFTEGNIDVLYASNYINVELATFRKSLVDVKPKRAPTFMYLGMGEK